MDRKRLGLSLKYKLLILLTVIPVASLAIYIAIATGLFEEDKISYVTEAGTRVTRSLATQLRMELNGFVDKIKPIVENFDYNSQTFSETSKQLFDRQERLDAIILIQKNATGQYVRLGEMHRPNNFGNSFVSATAMIDTYRDRAVSDEIFVSNLSESDVHLAIATRIGEASQVDHLVIVSLYRANDLHDAFTQKDFYKYFLLNKSVQPLLKSDKVAFVPEMFTDAYKSQQPFGGFEVHLDKPVIVSYADVGIAGMKITAVIEKSAALAAVNALLVKSMLFFIALISCTVIISVFASVQLTSALRELYDATKLIAQGKFDVRVKPKSNDEVGGLAEGFNFMAGEVSRLIIETSEKARMAGELETVKVVQETLFPAEQMTIGDYHIVGHFEAASECGGDWWNYSKVGDKLFLWVGDATGHGAPAAMVTSAAKSAATIIEDLPYITPGKALEIMNKAIHETTKSTILMTFFIASIDLKTGEVTYANASHESPYIIRKRSDDKPITKKDLEPLIEASGPRLGDKRGSVYKEAKTQLNKGDVILFYTDGILDVANKEKQAWGERKFIKAICDAAKGSTTPEKIDSLKKSIADYRQSQELVDDVTLFVCEYRDAV